MSRNVLGSLRRRLAGWIFLRHFLLLLGLFGTLAFSAVLLDAFLDLPEGLRAGAWTGPVAIFVAIIGFAGWAWKRLNHERLARLLELAEPSLGNRLINAVQLSDAERPQPIAEFLRREAIDLGFDAARKTRTWPAIRRGFLSAAALAGTALLGCGLLVLAGGEVLRAVAPRFLDPRGDHPPYSQLKIHVMPEAAEVLYGGQLEVRASTTGRPVDKLWLVAENGAASTRAIMFLAPDKTFFQSLANLREPGKYYVTDGQARSRRFNIGIRYTPQITLVELTTTFPEYTGKPGRTAQLSGEPQALPEDTRLTFRVASNRPLKSGALTLTPVLGGKPSVVPLLPSGGSNIVSGSFSLSQAVAFSISVEDINGLDSAEPRRGRFNILPDERPRLFVLEPGRDAVATPVTKVPIRVQAEDDYGIGRVVWLRGHNRSVERPLSMQVALKNGSRSVEASGVFDFEKLGVRPGDVVEYYFEAADNYPKGPNLALSRVYRVEIITREQYEMILRQAAARKALFEPYFQLGSWLRRLAERARELKKAAEAGAASPSDTAAFAADLAKYEGELGKLLQGALIFDVEQSFRETLVEQHTRISQLRKKLTPAPGSGQVDPKSLAEAAESLNEMTQSEEQDLDIPAREIAAVANVLARADSFVKLARQQATLAQMARRFSDRTEPLSRVEQIEMQELAYQQRRIEEALQSMLASFPDLLATLPDTDQYEPLRQDVSAFIKAIDEARIAPDLAESGKLLTALEGKQAYTVAQRAADSMDALVQKCASSTQQKGKLCFRFQPKVQQALGNTLEQILSAMGANVGTGENGRDGYGLFNDDVALYGPNVELAGTQAGPRRESGSSPGSRGERVAGDARDPALKPPEGPGRVRLQPDAKFPLRYRDLVGDYFRAIAESEDGGKKP